MECRLFFFLFLFSSAYRDPKLSSTNSAQNSAHKHIEVCTHRPSFLKTSFLRQQSSRANDDNNSTGVILLSKRRASWWVVHFEASYRIHNILVIVSPSYEMENRLLILLCNLTDRLQNPKHGPHLVVHKELGLSYRSLFNLNHSGQEPFRQAAVLCLPKSKVILKEVYVTAYVTKNSELPPERGIKTLNMKSILKGIFILSFLILCFLLIFIYLRSRFKTAKKTKRTSISTFHASVLKSLNVFQTAKICDGAQEQTKPQKARPAKVHKTPQETRPTANTLGGKKPLKAVGERLPSTLETDVTKGIDLMSATASQPHVVSSKQVEKKKNKRIKEAGRRGKRHTVMLSFFGKMKTKILSEENEEEEEEEEKIKKEKKEKEKKEKEKKEGGGKKKEKEEKEEEEKKIIKKEQKDETKEEGEEEKERGKEKEKDEEKNEKK